MTVHDAVTSWTESVNTQNFTVCVLQAGRKSGEILNPFATVDWLAYQGAPPNGMTGTIKMQKWWSGTKCEHVAFPRVKSQNSLYPTRKGGQKAAPWIPWMKTSSLVFTLAPAPKVKVTLLFLFIHLFFFSHCYFGLVPRSSGPKCFLEQDGPLPSKIWNKKNYLPSFFMNNFFGFYYFYERQMIVFAVLWEPL